MPQGTEGSNPSPSARNYMKTLRLTRFGNPILRKITKEIAKNDILSPSIQQAIADIRHTSSAKKYGVGLAAPQVGLDLRLSVIGIKPTPNRPDAKKFDQVIINPTYQGIGRRSGLWEGCLSCGIGDNTLYGKALRFRKVHATWYDEDAVYHSETLDGFIAHVFQHETDHLNGILFVDQVRDSKTYMMADEYRKRVVNKQS